MPFTGATDLHRAGHTPLPTGPTDDPTALIIRVGLRIVHENSTTGIITILTSGDWEQMVDSCPYKEDYYKWIGSKSKYDPLWTSCQIHNEGDPDAYQYLVQQ